MPSYESAQDDASEMDWLRAEVSGVLRDVAELEEAGVECDDAEDRIMIIIGVLREWLHFTKRNEYRSPEDVRAAADMLSTEARTALERIPRKKGVLQVPLVAALSHLQDFRDRILSCAAVPDEYRGEPA